MAATTGDNDLLVRPALVGDHVYSFLEAEILSGRIPGGARLGIRQLAERVGTSAIPVRDAINRLEEAGLAKKEPHKGAVVRQFSIPELIDIYRVRALLESQAARDGAAAITDSELAQMQTSLNEIERAVAGGQIGEAMAADSRMLQTLYRACGNTMLYGLIESLWKQCHYYRIMAATDAYSRKDLRIREPSRRIFEAAKSHDADAAGAEIQRSLEAVTRALRARADS